MDAQTRKKHIDAVEGNNQERDFKILECHALYPELTCKEIIEITGINIKQNRVGQILKENSLVVLRLFAQINPLFFKEGRAIELVKMYRRKTKLGVSSGKDSADILDALRKEVEGDNKTSIGVVIHNGKNNGEPKLNQSDIDFQNRIRADLKASRIL